MTSRESFLGVKGNDCFRYKIGLVVMFTNNVLNQTHLIKY